MLMRGLLAFVVLSNTYSRSRSCLKSLRQGSREGAGKRVDRHAIMLGERVVLFRRGERVTHKCGVDGCQVKKPYSLEKMQELLKHDRWNPHPNSVLADILREPGQPRLEAYQTWLEGGLDDVKAMDDWYKHGFGSWHEDAWDDSRERTGAAHENYERDSGERNFTIRPDAVRFPPGNRQVSSLHVYTDKDFKAPSTGLKKPVVFRTGRREFHG